MSDIVVTGDNSTQAIVTTATPVAIQVNGALRGDQGLQGPAGAIGATGPTGPIGPTGPAGIGDMAKSTYDLANINQQVVGTTAAQTLTNKTISGASNTLSNIPESAVTSLTTDLAAKVSKAGDTMTGALTVKVASGSNALISSVGGSATEMGAVVHYQSNSTTPATQSFLGIYDTGGAQYYGLSPKLPSPTGTSTLGGYYNGLGVGGSVSSALAGNNPIFGVLATDQSGYGTGHTAFTVLANNRVSTYNNTLDDGAGYAQFANTVTFQKLLATATGSGTTGAISTNWITVGTATGSAGGSASMFLDNKAGQIYEFYAGSNGKFGIWDKTANKNMLSIDNNTGYAYFPGTLETGSYLYAQNIKVWNGWMQINAATGAGRSTIDMVGHNVANDGDTLTLEMRTDTAAAVLTAWDVSANVYHEALHYDYVNDLLYLPNALPSTSTFSLGGSGNYWANLYANRHYLNSTAYLDGASAGTVALTGKLSVTGIQTIYVPDQTNFTGSMFFGQGGSSLSHVTGSDGMYNTGLGKSALFAITTGNANVAIGFTAGANITSGSSNLAIGEGSLNAVVSASSNIGIGAYALYSITGGANIGIGGGAGNNITASYNNVLIGVNAGRFIANGTTPTTALDNSVVLGNNAYPKTQSDVNEIVIGYSTIGNGSNTATIGNSSLTDFYIGATGLASLRSSRLYLNSTAYLDGATAGTVNINAKTIMNDTLYQFYGVGLGSAGANASIQLLIGASADNHQGIVIFGNSATQSANLFDIQNSSFASMFTVSATGNITLGDAKNITVGTTTGTKIGTATTQKIGFYNATPIVQPSAYTQTYATADKTLAALTSAALTNSTGGTVSTTLAAITAGTTYAQADLTAIKNGMASLADQVNKGRTDHLDLAQMLNALIDDLQALGIIG